MMIKPGWLARQFDSAKKDVAELPRWLQSLPDGIVRSLDMGYAIIIATCIACKQTVHCNPKLVPSLRVNGQREPLCHSCATRWNQLHPENAREINPTAYEPCDESEL